MPDSGPVSASQYRTWYRELVAPGIAQHHLSFALDLFGDLEIAALQLSLDFLVERHEVLQMRFVDDRGELRQVIGGRRAIVGLIDVPAGPNTDLNAILRDQVSAPFDLERGPPLRLVVLRRAPEVQVLVFVLHHIVADNLSLGLFAREMAEAYRAFSARSIPSFAPLPWQFSDFAIAEARWLASPVYHARLMRYAARIGPATARLHFEPGHSGEASADSPLLVDTAVVNRLKQVAQGLGVTLFTVLLAAIQTVLAPNADGQGFVIAVPVAGRTADGAQDIIGPFANLVGLSANLHSPATIAELLTDTGRQLLDALECENIPWDALVRVKNPSRSADAPPLGQVILSSITQPTSFQRFGRMPCREVWLPSPPPPCELFVGASESPDGALWIRFDRQMDKVSAGAVARLSGALESVLGQIAAGDPARIVVHPGSRAIAVARRHIGGAAGAGVDNRIASQFREVASVPEGLEERITELWQQLLGASPRTPHENFFDAGGDSLLAVRLMSQVGLQFDRKLPIGLFLKDPTVAGLMNSLRQDIDIDKLDYAIVKLADGGDGRVLFVSTAQDGLDEFVTMMGPGPSVYRLDAYFLQEQRLLAGQPMLDTVEDIAEQFRSRMQAVQPKGPYLLAGGCEGGVLLYELALQLQRQGEEVALLAMMDTPVRGFWESKPGFLGPLRQAKRLFLELVSRRMSRAKTPEEEQLERVWAKIWQAVRSYQPEHLFDGDIHQFKATKARFGLVDVAAGWSSRITGQVSVHLVPGDHMTWLTNPKGSAIVSAVLEAVSPASASSGAPQ